MIASPTLKQPRRNNMFIENVNGTRYVWQRFVFKATATRNVDTYCADGDGFVEVRTCNGVYGLYDQGERIRTFHATSLDQALRMAELYADATYPTMLDAYLIERFYDFRNFVMVNGAMVHIEP
jgi:hypothetical protein